MEDGSAAVRLEPVEGPGCEELRRFYDRSFDEVYQYAVRLTGGASALAEDLVQEAFLSLVRAWRDERIDRLEVGWPITVVRQRFLDGIRGRRREQRRLELVGRSDRADVDVFEPREALALLGRLPDRPRAALILRYVDDLPVADVASALKISRRAAESLLARGRRQLKSLIEEERHG